SEPSWRKCRQTIFYLTTKGIEAGLPRRYWGQVTPTMQTCQMAAAYGTFAPGTTDTGSRGTSSHSMRRTTIPFWEPRDVAGTASSQIFLQMRKKKIFRKSTRRPPRNIHLQLTDQPSCD